jgi:hypothetical protein
MECENQTMPPSELEARKLIMWMANQLIPAVPSEGEF